jgi:hypothetical protein
MRVEQRQVLRLADTALYLIRSENAIRGSRLQVNSSVVSLADGNAENSIDCSVRKWGPQNLPYGTICLLFTSPVGRLVSV